MRDHDHRLAVVLDRLVQQLEDLAAGLRVEVAGRLVGEDDCRAGDERARDRDALLLAAGELGGPVGQAVGEPDPLDEIPEELLVRLLAGERERQRHVLLGGQHREQVEELEDEADVLAPDLRDVLVAQLSEPGAGDRDVAVGRAVERRQDVHQRRLAGARRAHDRRQLALLDVQRDAAKRVDRRVALAVAPVDVVR